MPSFPPPQTDMLSEEIDDIIISGGQTSRSRMEGHLAERSPANFPLNPGGLSTSDPDRVSYPGGNNDNGDGPEAQTATTAAESQATETSSAASTTSDSEGVMLPVWAIVVIIIGAIMVLTFIVSLVFFCVRERRKSYERGKNASYGRAVRRALAAASGAFIPIWIAKRFSSKRRKGTQQGEAYAKIDGLLTHEHSQSSLTYVSPAPAFEPVSMPTPASAPAPAPAPAPLMRRNPSVVSSLSSGSARGRYERVGTNQSLAEENASRAAGLQRNPSLVSALSSTDERREYSTSDIPPPTPMSDGAPTFTSPERPPNRHTRDSAAAAARNQVYYSP